MIREDGEMLNKSHEKHLYLVLAIYQRDIVYHISFDL